MATLPYSMSCNESGDGLYQLEDGRFQLISDGPIVPLMVGWNYVLAENALAEFLASRALHGVSLQKAIIFRRRSNEQYDTHKRVLIGRHFEYGDIGSLDLDAEDLLLMDSRYIFVSPELKRELEAAGFQYLRFSEGLSEFAGSV